MHTKLDIYVLFTAKLQHFLSLKLFALNLFTYLPESKFRKEKKIYSNKFFHNFHLSESSFTRPGLQASGLVQRLFPWK